jgi:hypothetical protein
MMMIRKLIYRPLDYFPEMADLLADIVHGNGSAFAAYKQRAHKPTCPFSKSNSDHDSCQTYSGGWEVTKAILCSDGRDITNTTKEDFRGIRKALYQQSRWMGEFWSTVTLPCVHWRVRPKWGITAGKKLTCGNTRSKLTAYQMRLKVKLHIQFCGLEILWILLHLWRSNFPQFLLWQG